MTSDGYRPVFQAAKPQPFVPMFRRRPDVEPINRFEVVRSVDRVSLGTATDADAKRIAAYIAKLEAEVGRV